MRTIPDKISQSLRQTLLSCGSLHTDGALRTIFADSRLLFLRGQLQDTTAIDERVDSLIALLREKENDKGENSLLLFLQVLKDRTHPGDACYDRIDRVIQQLRSISVREPSGYDPTPPQRVWPDFSPTKYEFINRENDIRSIHEYLLSESYLQLLGPSGIGKSSLAHELRTNPTYFRHHPSAYLEFSSRKFRPETESVVSLLETLRRQLFANTPQGITLSQVELVAAIAQDAQKHQLFCFIVLDDIHLVYPDVLNDFRSNVLPELEKIIGNPKLYPRIIAIAQYEVVALRGTKLITFKPHSLGEFRGILEDPKTYKSLLRQAFQRATGKDLDVMDVAVDNRLRRWAHELYRLTAGHPYAIERVLEYVGRETNFANADVFTEHRVAISTHVLKALVNKHVISEVRSPHLQQAFEIMWVFRYLAKGIIGPFLEFIQNKDSWYPVNEAVKHCCHEDDISYILFWQALSQTRLLQPNRERTHFFSHQLAPIWRRLNNQVLATTDPNLYHNLNMDLSCFFQRLAFNRELPEELRISCYIESLYHHCQANLESGEDHEVLAQQILQSIRNFLITLETSGAKEEYEYDLLGLLESDKELGGCLSTIDCTDVLQQLLTEVGSASSV